MVRDCDHLIRPVSCSPFLLADSHRLSVPKVIAATPVFGRVKGHNALAAPPLFHPDHRVAGEPVMGVNNVERTNELLRLKYVVYKRPTHIVDFIDEVGMEVKWTAVIMHTVDACIVGLALPHP